MNYETGILVYERRQRYCDIDIKTCTKTIERTNCKTKLDRFGWNDWGRVRKLDPRNDTRCESCWWIEIILHDDGREGSERRGVIQCTAAGPIQVQDF